MAEETTGEKGFKLTSKETGEFVSYLIAHECTPAKTLVAEECTVEEAQAWIDEQAAEAEAARKAQEEKEREEAAAQEREAYGGDESESE